LELGDPGKRLELVAKRDSPEEIRAYADAGDGSATWQLVDLLWGEEPFNELIEL
jgi:hypothetical protein